MQWELRRHGVELDAGISSHIERRLTFALSRFGARTGRIVVFLSDLNGPKGGIDKNCQIVVRLKGLGEVVAEVTDTEWIVAVDRAATRIGHNVSRELERIRDTRRATASPTPM